MRSAGDLLAAGLLAALALGGCSREPAAKAPAAAAPASPAAAERPLPDPLPFVAATVDGRAIATSLVVGAAEAALAREAGATQAAVYRRTLEQLIERELLLGEALRRRLSANDRELEAAYDAARVPFKDDAAWAEALKRQGLTPQAFRTELRAKRTVDRLIAAVTAEVAEPSQAEARAFFDADPGAHTTREKLRAAHILFALQPGAAAAARAEARARAEAALARLRAGEDFAELARQLSDDKATAGDGGELQPFGRGQAAPPLEQAAFALRPGQVSEPVELPTGYHLVKLIEKVPPRPLAFEEIGGSLRQHLWRQRKEERLRALLERLRAEARIEKFL